MRTPARIFQPQFGALRLDSWRPACNLYLTAVRIPLVSINAITRQSPGPPLESDIESLAGGIHDLQTIPSGIYNDLVFYFKYASTAYGVPCHLPNGDVLVQQFTSDPNKLKGFIVRNHCRKEIVIAFRGSGDIEDVLTDSQIRLVPLDSPGIRAPEGALVHFGFLMAWNDVASEVTSTVATQLEINPDHSIVTTGHSLGGALSSLAAISLKSNFPGVKTQMYTYGQPRTGNRVYAHFINSEFGRNAFRAVHMNDGVPTMVPRALGYHHHGIEYWQYIEPPHPRTTVQCDPDGEDIFCSAGIVPSGGINTAHLIYFGIPAGTPFCHHESFTDQGTSRHMHCSVEDRVVLLPNRIVL